MLFDIERASIEQLIRVERAVLGIFAAGAIAGTFSPLLLPQASRIAKTLSLGYGMVSAGAFTLCTHLQRRKEKIYQSIDAGQLQELKQQMTHAIAYSSSVGKIEATRKLAAFVQQLPPWEQSRWVQQFGLQGLVEPPTLEAEVRAYPGLTTDIRSEQSSFGDLSEELAPAIDYSWLDERFLCASKGVFGARGSGKSTYLSFQALQFLQFHPDGELRIGDIHYDEEESQWLPGTAADELLDKYVATHPTQILALFRRARQLLRERIDSRDRKAFPFHFICDEFVGFMSRLTDDERFEVVKIIEDNSFEGRKYGVSITLGLHSLKKQMTGIDSSALLSGMDLLFLGRSLADPATKFPADIDAKRLLTEQEQLQAVLNEQDGRACVVRKLGDVPVVVVLPFIDLTGYSASQDADWYEEITAWVQGLGRKPQPQELRAKWEVLTGQTLNDEGLKLLREHLGI